MRGMKTRWQPMNGTTWWVLLHPTGVWWCEKAFWDADLARRTARAWNSIPPKYPDRYPGGSWRVRVVRMEFVEGKPKGGRMASGAKVYRVVVEQQRSGGWKWTPTDAQGKVKLAGGRSDYGRKSSAVRGARRACGAKIRIAFA